MPRRFHWENGIANTLIARFSDETLDRWKWHLQHVPLVAGTDLYEAGTFVEHVYFPLSGVIALGFENSSHRNSTLCLFGKNGMVGLQMVLGNERSVESAKVLIGGFALRLEAGLVRTEMARGGEVAQLLLARTQLKMTRLATSAFCNRHHSLEQQLCQRLLEMMELTGNNEFVLTQSELADLVGGRREQVNRKLGELRDAGTLQMERNSLRVTEPSGIWARVCDCHKVLSAAEARLMANHP